MSGLGCCEELDERPVLCIFVRMRDVLMVLALLALLGPIPAHATVLCEGGWPHGPDRHAWRCTGPAWLVRHDAAGESRTLGSVPLCQSEVRELTGPVSDAPTLTGWQRTGVYGLEFGSAAVGTATAGAVAIGFAWAVLPHNDDVQPDLAVGIGLGTALIPSPVLAATGTYFGGKIVRQHGSFWRTLVGSLVGGVVGTALAYGYNISWTSHHNYYGTTQTVVTLSCAVVPTWLGSVVAYNAWK